MLKFKLKLNSDFPTNTVHVQYVHYLAFLFLNTFYIYDDHFGLYTHSVLNGCNILQNAWRGTNPPTTVSHAIRHFNVYYIGLGVMLIYS